MLQIISWIGYLKVVMGCLAIYYVYVLVKFFPEALSRLRFSGKKQKEDIEEWSAEEIAQPKEQTGGDTPEDEEPEENDVEPDNNTIHASNAPKTEAGQMPLAYKLGGEIRQLLERAANEKMVKEELVMGLQLLLTGDLYSILKNGQFHNPILMLIRSEAENICSIHFESKELDGLWES